MLQHRPARASSPTSAACSLTALSVIIGIAFLAGTLRVHRHDQAAPSTTCSPTSTRTPTPYVRSNQSIEGDFGFEQRRRSPGPMLARCSRQSPASPRPRATCRASPRIIGKDGDKPSAGNGPPHLRQQLLRGRAVTLEAHVGQPRPDRPTRGRARLTARSRTASSRSAIRSRSPAKRQPAVHRRRRGQVRRHRTPPAAPPSPCSTCRPRRPPPPNPDGTTQDELSSISVRSDGSVSHTDLADVAATDPRRRHRGADRQADHRGDPERHPASAVSSSRSSCWSSPASSLFVACFIIYNMFSIIVGPAAAGDARCCGPSAPVGARSLNSILMEALFIGLVASLIGFAGGILLATGLQDAAQAFGIDIPAGGIVLLPRTLIVLAHRRHAHHRAVGARAGPQGGRDPAGGGDARRAPSRAPGPPASACWWGIVLIALGAALTSSASPASRSPCSGSASPLIFIGVFVLGPLIARPLRPLIGKPLAAVKGITGRLARENATRNPKRTARTAAA